jgi:hypothetical protein
MRNLRNLPIRVFCAALLVSAVTGCASDDDLNEIDSPDSGMTTDAAETDTGVAQTDMDVQPDLGVAPQEVGLNIAFDFRFDRAGFFGSPEARGVLDEAARQWGVWLQDDFDTIVAGTIVYTRDPEDTTQEPFIEIENDIDDVLVFVGSAPRDGSIAGSSATAAFPPESDDPVLRAALKERWESAEDFEPWTAWMSFDPGRTWFFDPTPETSDDIPVGSSDALSVTLHELGHILGFAPGPAFSGHVVNGAFEGPNAMEVYGGPVPLTADRLHIADGVTIDGKVPVMATFKPSGVRYEITRLDRAILADIGYEVP